MAESTIEKKETVKPIRLIDNETGDTYILEFDRDTVRWAEDRGFDPDLITKYPMTVGTDFFYYAFRMHHRNTVSKEKTDKIFFDMLGGFNDTTGKILGRLRELYYETYITFRDDEVGENPRMAVEL
jgi:hypothetical protein